MSSGNQQPSIDSSEHIGPSSTGDNIDAKRVASYGWNGTSWERIRNVPLGLLTTDYDYVSVAYPTTSSEVYTFKLGGSGGTTTDTITITYTDDTKDNLSTAARS